MQKPISVRDPTFLWEQTHKDLSPTLQAHVLSEPWAILKTPCININIFRVPVTVVDTAQKEDIC